MAPPETIGLIVASVIGFVALWLVVCAVISRIGGWHRLASEFSVPRKPGLAPRIRLRSAQMRFYTNYNNVIRLDVDAQGLSLSVMYVFSFQHPPLRIPWDQIEVWEVRVFWIFSGTRLLLGRDARIPLVFYNREARELVAQFAKVPLLQKPV